jgi:hypothetical protein
MTIVLIFIFLMTACSSQQAGDEASTLSKVASSEITVYENPT